MKEMDVRVETTTHRGDWRRIQAAPISNKLGQGKKEEKND
jgi:hypothetical protein